MVEPGAGGGDRRLRRGLFLPRRFEAILLLVDQPLLDGTPLGQLGDPVELLPAIFPRGRGAGRVGPGLFDPMLGHDTLFPRDFQGVLGLDIRGHPRPGPSDIVARLSLADGRLAGIPVGAGDSDAQLRPTLVGFCHAQSILLLLEQALLDRSSLDQLSDADALLAAVFQLGGLRSGIRLGHLEVRLAGLQQEPGGCEVGLGELEPDLVLLGRPRLGFRDACRTRLGRGRFLGHRLSRDKPPGHDPGGADGQQGEGPGQEPSAGWWLIRLHRHEPPSE